MEIAELQQMGLKYLDRIKQIIYSPSLTGDQKIEEIFPIVDRMTLKFVSLKDDDVNNNDNRG